MDEALIGILTNQKQRAMENEKAGSGPSIGAIGFRG